MGLSELRDKIDAIDIQLQKLFEERMAICDEVAREKKRTNAPVLQGNRERKIIEAVRSRANAGFEDSSEEFLKAVMAISRGRQKKLLSESVAIPNGSNVNVIIACGGSSSRMGFNKLLYSLEGKEVILRTIDIFDGMENVSRVILSATEEMKKSLSALLARESYKTEIVFADSGETRQESVANGVMATTDDCDYVCIQDGARPFTKRDTVLRCIEDAKQTGAAVVCVPVKDTIKISADGIVTDTPKREMLFSAQTPQVVARDIYRLAIESAKALQKTYTDDVSLCEAIGVMPKITVGDYSNIKLTTTEDIELAKSLFRKDAK